MLPWLATNGNRIVDRDTGSPVRLRGVNRSGLEYSEPSDRSAPRVGFNEAAGLSFEDIRNIVEVWGSNIIRLPINQDWALRGRRGWTAETYLQDIDQVIDWASGFGAYTLLDLQWLHADRPFGGNRNFVAPLPDLESIEFWRILAARHRRNTAVLYDLFNEPHDRLADDPYPMRRPDGTFYPADRYKVGVEDWKPWAIRLIDEIRAVHPDSLIFVSGTEWGFDLRGVPFTGVDLRPNIAYSTHVYPNKGAGFLAGSFETRWTRAFGRVSQDVPVFAGELGGYDLDIDWGRRLFRYLDEREIGWTAWSWSDRPHLRLNGLPTPFGLLVQEALLSTPRPQPIVAKLSWPPEPR